MKRINVAIIIFICLPGFNATGQQDQLPRPGEMKEAERIFGKQISYVPVPFRGDTGKLIEFLHPGDLLFRIASPGGDTGYLLSTRAMGRYDYFDYAVIFNQGLRVEGVKVTRYRSDHGAAICQRRWLRQFTGYRGGPLHLGKDIDAVSGGTISAGALVDDIQRCHRLLEIWMVQ